MAGLAVLLFAVEDGHGTPVGWICNRNVLVAASFGVACLIAHDAWRREEKRWAQWPALLLWTCSLCSKEAGIATVRLFVRFTPCGSMIPRSGGASSPSSPTASSWSSGGSCGTRSASAWITLASTSIRSAPPARSSMALAERYPVFLLGQWVFPSDVSVAIRKLLGSPFWWAGVISTGVLGLLFWPVLRRDRIARFFVTGMLLAVLPICATFPTDTTAHVSSGLGAFGLMFAILVCRRQRRGTATGNRLVASRRRSHRVPSTGDPPRLRPPAARRASDGANGPSLVYRAALPARAPSTRPSRSRTSWSSTRPARCT